MNTFLSILGQAVISPVESAATSAADYAMEAFYVLAGELLVIILLLAGILLWGVAVL